MSGFEDVPLPSTPLGARFYEVGRGLVRQGIRPAHVMWDADEVLWRWLMDMGDLTRRLPQLAMRRGIGHREFILRRPGLLELLWGMRHEALERGFDPRIRVWTDGYPWRLWRIDQEIPGLGTLLGIEGDAPEAWASAGTVFYRQDYARALRALSPRETLERWVASLPEASRSAAERQFALDPYDTSFKLPELAALIGKDGFSEIRFLVDDREANVRRFAEAGRRAVQVLGREPAIFGARLKNVVWGRPKTAQDAGPMTTAEGIGAALLELARGAGGATTVVAGAEAEASDLAAPFTIVIPSDRISAEWLQPMRRLRRERARSGGG